VAHSYKIMFLGPSGVGKTTLLASFYKEMIEGALQNSEIVCTNHIEEMRLREKMTEVAKVQEDQIFDYTDNRLKGDQGFSHYPFRITRSDQDLIEFEVVDHRGGDIRLNSLNLDARDKLTRELSEADCILVVIDAAIMMVDEGGQYGSRLNQYTAISDYIRDRLEKVERPVLIQFLLTKCERWWRGDARTDVSRGGELLKRAKQNLRQSLQFIQHAAQEGKPVVSLITPVLTMNCVEYWRRKPGAELELVFRRVPHVPYAPEVSQPLFRALAFCLTGSLEGFNIFTRWFDRKRRAEAQLLVSELSELSALTHLDEEVIGDQSLLQLEDRGQKG